MDSETRREIDRTQEAVQVLTWVVIIGLLVLAFAVR